MKPVTMYQTFDGKIHMTSQTASRHLNDLYYKLLHKLTGDMILLDLTNGMNYIDNHLSEFQTLQEIKTDMKLLEDGDCH